MCFLDLDLDFFLNKNAYSSGNRGGRLGLDFRPWSISRVRHFLEDRCGLSPDSPTPGRVVESHDGVLEFWRQLIKSGRLKIPFDVVHIDAHPDLWVGDIIYRTSDSLHISLERGLTILEKRPVNAGNYLTFAIAYGWIGSITWVPLHKSGNTPPWDGDSRIGLLPAKNMTDIEKEGNVHYKVLSWRKFQTKEKFDYMVLSRSPDFTPAASDRLIDIIEEYMKQI